MVQRQSLLGTVSVQEQSMAAKCLRSISGMAPRSFEHVREVWVPKFRYDPTAAPGPHSQIEQHRLFVVRLGNQIKLESYEVPEAGRNIKVVSQAVLSADFVSEQIAPTTTVENFLAELGYEHQSTHIMRGTEYVLHDQIVMHLFQLYSPEGLPLDDSQQSTAIAYVDVSSVRDLPAVQKSTQLLLTLQQELRGVIALRIPNRNAFSTRMPRVTA